MNKLITIALTVGVLATGCTKNIDGTVDPDMRPVTTSTNAPMPFAVSSMSMTWAVDGYVHAIKPTSPCARSMRMVRHNHGAEDDMCAAWIGPRGNVQVGPLSDAPAYANIVGS